MSMAVVKSIRTVSGEVLLIVNDKNSDMANSLSAVCMAAVERAVFQFFPEPDWNCPVLIAGAVEADERQAIDDKAETKE